MQETGMNHTLAILISLTRVWEIDIRTETTGVEDEILRLVI